MNTRTRHLPGCPAHPARQWHSGACICGQEPPPAAAPRDDAADALALEIHDARPSAPTPQAEGH